MTTMSAQKIYKLSKVNPIVLLIGFVLIMVVIFKIAKGVLSLLAFAAPFVFIAALVINYKVVVGYGKWLIAAFKRNPVFGIVASVFTLLGFPLVAIFLLFRALSSRGMTQKSTKKLGEFINYEEVDDDFLDISDIQDKKKKLDNDYTDVF